MAKVSSMSTTVRKASLPYEERVQARALESDLFGGAEELIERLAGDANDSVDDDGRQFFGVSTYVRDVSTADGVKGDEEVFTARAAPVGKSRRSKRKPAWVDDDDAANPGANLATNSRLRKLRLAEGETTVSGSVLEKRLRGQHAKLNPATAWAEPKRNEADVDDVDADTLESSTYLRRVGGIVEPASQRVDLPPGNIEMTRVRDANMHQRSKAVVQCVEFHPNGQLLMAAGFDKHLRFYNADGVRNSVVQSVFLEDLPIHTARFASGGASVVASGHRKFFYVLDLESQKVERIKNIQGFEDKSLAHFVVPPAATCGDQKACITFLGNEGHVPLVSLHSRQWVGELKMNGSVRSAAYSADGTQLYTAGGDGLVYVWDVRMRRCVHRHRDEGCVNSTSLAIAPSGHTFAAGADSGVVNVYRAPTTGAVTKAGATPVVPAQAPPLRAFTNLVTSIDTLAFNADSQLLCIGSRLKKDALRLVHVPTLTVFSNWPTARSPLHYVHCACFSPNSGFLAVGNAKGHVLLYRLHHYARA